MDTPGTMLSRSGKTNADGKLTHRIDVPVSEETHDAVGALATIDGISKAEWVRVLVEETVHGRLGMVRRLTRTSVPGPSDECQTGSRN